MAQPRNALKGWHREYEQRLDLPVGYAGFYVFPA